MPEIKVDVERCKGCELCIINCPKEILRFSENVNQKGYHYLECFNPEECTGCAICAIICPEVAIEVFK